MIRVQLTTTAAVDQRTQYIHQGLFVLRFGAGADVSTDILSIETDLNSPHQLTEVVAFLPVSLLWRVKLPIRRKLMLSCLLCGSLITVVVAFLRIEVTSKMSYLPNPVWLNFWSGIEGAVGEYLSPHARCCTFSSGERNMTY